MSLLSRRAPHILNDNVVELSYTRVENKLRLRPKNQDGSVKLGVKFFWVPKWGLSRFSRGTPRSDEWIITCDRSLIDHGPSVSKEDGYFGHEKYRSAALSLSHFKFEMRCPTTHIQNLFDEEKFLWKYCNFVDGWVDTLLGSFRLPYCDKKNLTTNRFVWLEM